MKRYFFILSILSFLQLVSQTDIKLSSRVNKDNSLDILYSSNQIGSYSIYIDVIDYNNTYPPRKKFTIDDYSGILCTLRPIDKDKYIFFNYHYSYVRGISDPKIDNQFVYLLPFPNQTITKVFFPTNIGEKYFGIEPPPNWKVFGFTSDKPDTVCAIRKGIVIEVIDNYSPDTLNEYRFYRNKNRVIVEHEDGTIASYSGLDSKNIFVKPGTKIIPNQAIGKLAQYDKNAFYLLNLSIFYLTENKNHENSSEKKHFYVYVDPLFQTENGPIKLEENTKYVSTISNEIVIKELKKREIKNIKRK